MVAGHLILSQQWIPLLFFTNYPGKVILCPIHPPAQSTPRQNRQQQPHYNFLSQQCTYHCCCHGGESLAKTHFIHHHRFWQIWIPKPPCHNEQYHTNLMRQELPTGKSWDWILVARNMDICWLANRMGIQQPDCRIKSLVLKFLVDHNEISIDYWTRIFWIEDLLTILHWLLNLPWTFVCVLFILNDLFQLLQCMLGRWAHIPALVKFIAMLGILLTSNHLNKSLWMEYNQFNSFNQNLH